MKQKTFTDLVKIYKVSKWIKKKLKKNKGYSIKLPPSIVNIDTDESVLVTIVIEKNG